MDVYSLTGINSDYLNTFAVERGLTAVDTDEPFSSVLSEMMKALNETNELNKNAQEEEIRFALGYSDNTHDLMVAAAKASVALQYTVAVRDKLIQGYQELMQMQI